MIHRYLSLKIAAIITFTTIIMTGCMWTFNVIYSARDLTAFTRGLPVFIFTVLFFTLSFSALVMRYLRYLIACLQKIEGGTQPPLEDRLKARQLIVRLPLFIIILNIMGFLMGPMINIMILNLRDNAGSLLVPKDFLIIFYNMTIGVVSAFTQIILSNLVLTKPKQLLRIESFNVIKGKIRKDMPLLLKNIIIPFSIALLLASLFFVAGIKAYEENYRFTIDFVNRIEKKQPVTATQKIKLDEINKLLPLETKLLAYINAKMAAEGITPPATELAGEQMTAQQATAIMNELEELAKQKDAAHFDSFIILFIILACIALFYLFFYSQEQKTLLTQIKLKVAEIIKGKGDLTQRLSIIHFDETGELVSFLNLFYEYLHNLIVKVKIASQEVINSSASLLNFIEKISHFINDINTLTEVVINNTAKQADIVNGTKEAIETLRSSIDKISNNVGTQASFIEENSASITEMTTNINSVNSIVQNATSLSEKLLQALKEGEEKIENTIENIRNIETSSNEMNEIINLISDIATQTNLLSMNAAIEAAHAGDAGKSFSVVAEEVRKLSDDSAEKADNIAAHIKTMNAYIESGVNISESTEQALLQIKKDVEATTELLQTIFNAMQEQSAGTEEILASTRSVVEATEDIRQLTTTQKERSEKIQLMIENFIESETEVKKNITNQTERYKEFTNSLDRVKDILKKNSEVAQNLDQMLSQFKL